MLAVIPFPPHSDAILRVRPMSPAFEAQYAPCLCSAACAAWDEMLTILPGGGGLGDDSAALDAAKYSLANACEQSIGP